MVDLNNKNISAFLKKENEALVLFYADWCPYCKAFLKTLEENKTSLKHRVNYANISDYEDPMWDTFKVDAVPTLVLFSKGEERARKTAILYKGLTKDDLTAIDNVG